MSAQYTFTIYTFDNVLYSMDQGYNGTLINNPHILAISRDDLTTYILYMYTNYLYMSKSIPKKCYIKHFLCVWGRGKPFKYSIEKNVKLYM